MEDTWIFFTENLLPYLPWFVGAFGFWFIGKFMKAQVWTKKKASTPGKLKGFYHFMRRTLAIHSTIAGILVGLMPGVPVSPGVETLFATVLYWASAGVFASFGVHVLTEFFAKKTGVDIEAAADAAVNPSMKPDDDDKS